MAQYIDCYWFLEKEPADAGIDYPKLYPDPSAHFIFATDDVTQSYQHGGQLRQIHGSHMIHPHQCTWVLNHIEPFAILGLKFNLGAIYDMGLEIKIDQVEPCELATLLSLQPISPCDLLNAARSNPQAVCASLDDYLSPWFNQLSTDSHSLLAKKAVEIMEEMALSKIGAALHKSQRTLERSFLRVTGLTLKQCHSIKRLETLLHHLYETEIQHINWADLAVQYHFSDQPHLIRHLKNTLGTTPGSYVKQRDLTIDAYGDFEVK